MKKKIILCITGLAMLAMIVPSSAQAVTAAELQAQIDALMATLADLQSQLADLTGETGGTVTGCTITSFDRNLKVGMSGDDVKCLQVVLNSASDTQLSAGVGSPGQETSYFGPKTKAAVIKFQEKYAADILAGYGLTAGTGYVGTTTRAKLNTMLDSGVVPPAGAVCGNGTCETGETSTNCPADCPVPPAAAGLTVSLASDTPTSTSVADATNANFTKFTLTAGSEGSVSITKIYVTRAGLSANADVENIKVVEADTGTYRGSVGSLNVDNRSMITFTPALIIPAGTTKTYFLRAGIAEATTSGKTISLGIVAATDIVSNATAVTGVPIVGNVMTAIELTVGDLSVEEDGTTIDTTPDVGDVDVTLNQFKLSAGSPEAITVESITAIKVGTASLTDTTNIELYDVTHNVSLGTVASWDSEEKATWSNLGLIIDKGESLRLKIMADVVGGVASTALTVNADIVDGTDTLIDAKGNVYGFYLTVAEGDYSGQGAYPQTINAGALNLSKSSSTPATGNISTGSDIVLGVFDFDAKGEEMRITGITIEAVISGMVYTDITLVKIYDEDGNIVAGPKDMATTDATHCYASFTDTFIVPVGVHEYTVKAKIADAVETGETIVIDINTPGTTSVLVVKGMTSGDTITATPSGDLAANTLTVAAGDMVVTTLTTPAARDVTKGVNDFIWATASLSAGNSGEDVLITTISVLDTLSADDSTDPDADDIDNMEIWADLTSANSLRGDIYETKVSNTENPSGNTAGVATTTSFTLSQTITVPVGSFVKVALVADLNASAVGTVGTSTHTFSFSAVTATGASSGEDISESASGTGQAMQIETSGALTLTKDENSLVSDIVISGETVTLGVFRLAATNVESLDVDDITFAVTGGTSVSTYYLYNGTNQIGIASSGTTPKFVLANGTVTVPANDYVKLTLKGKMNIKDYVTNDTAITAGLNAEDAVNCTGLASGAEVDSDDTDVAANEMNLYVTKPTFTAVTTRSGYSLSGTLIPSTAMLVAIFDVTASDTEDVTFQKDIASLTVNVSRVQTDTDGSVDTWLLKDQDGTLLDSITIADSASEADFIFATAGLTIPAGDTKSFFIYADTSEYEDDGDVIQVWLDDATASNTDITWSINDNDATYYDGDKIFRNDIYAGSFVNPS